MTIRIIRFRNMLFTLNYIQIKVGLGLLLFLARGLSLVGGDFFIDFGSNINKISSKF